MRPAEELSNASRTVLPAAIGGLVLAAGFGLLRFFNTEPPLRMAEWSGGLAMAGALATPALLALLGLRGRPALLLAGGALGILFAVLGAISLVSLILVVPSVFYLVGSSRVGRWPSVPRTAATVLLSVILGFGGLFVLFVTDDPVCWAQMPRGGGSTYVRITAEPFVRGNSISVSSEDLPPGSTASGCSTDSISSREAFLSFVLAAATLGVVWAVGSPGAQRPLRSPGITSPG